MPSVNEPFVAWNGYATTDTAVVCCFVPDDGTLEIEANGVTYTQAVTAGFTPANNFGCYAQTLTGLTQDTRYTVTFRLNGATVGQTSTKTFPASSSAKFMWLSCIGTDRHERIQGRHLEAEDPDLAVFVDDTPYADAGYHVEAVYTNEDLTESIRDGAPPNYESDTHHAYRQLNFRLRPDVQQVTQRFPCVYVAGDHEIADDWDHSRAKAALPTTLDATLTQPEVDAVFKRGWDAWQAFSYIANPPHADGDTAEKPPEADGTTPAANYPPVHSRLTLGAAELFLVDTVSHRAATGGDATILGAQQLAWVQARVAGSPSPNKVVVLANKLLGSSNANGWQNAETERAALLTSFSAVPGVTSVAGDQHDIEVNESRTDAGNTYNHVSICIAPTSNENGDAQIDSSATLGETVFRARPSTGTADRYLHRHGYGVGEVSVSGIRFSIKNPSTGQTYYRMVRAATDNVIASGAHVRGAQVT